MIQAVRRALYPLYERSPEAWRKRMRDTFKTVSAYSMDAKSRWIRSTYGRFGTDERRRIFLDIAHFQHINRPIRGYYLEFGSHEANTMRMAWDSTRHLFDLQYIAFDSFEGLPDIEKGDEQQIWEKGRLATAEEAFLNICRRHGMPADRLRTVRGFYDRTLTQDLVESLLPTKAAIIYVDCDLYASTVPVLEFARHFLQPGTVVVFDDWNCFLADPEKGERRAWAEFRSRYPELRFEDFVQTGMQKAFVYLGPSQSSP